MSWSAFDELKTFASKIKDQCKRKKDWNKPSSKKQKSSDKVPVEEQGGIDGFSSEEEEELAVNQNTSHSARHQTHDQKPPRKSPRKHIISSNNSCTRSDVDVLIDDIEDTPENDQPQTKATTSNNTNAPVTEDQIHLDESEDEKESEILDVAIKDFNSSDEEEEKIQKTEELDIDTPTPTPTPSSASSTPTPTAKHSAIPELLSTTGSEWLKRVQTPTREAPSSPNMKAEIDSAKKTKQKFKRSGLAEQLQKVINREKSEKTFWAHKQTAVKNELNDTSQETTSTLDVQVLSLYNQYSLHITRCCVLSSNQDNNTPVVVDVVFNAETVQYLMPRVGCAVRIHPPWQKLHPPSSPYPILLCTYYCEKLSTPTGSPLVDVTTLSDFNTMPDKPDQGSSLLVQSPQKAFKPTKLLFGATTDNNSSTEVNTVKPSTSVCYTSSELKQTSKISSIAQAIEIQGGCSGGCVSFQAVIQRVYRRKVRIPREKTIDSPGHLVLSKSLITRARSGENKVEERWILLVQDSSLNLCEIQIPVEFSSQDEWISCRKSGEGKSFVFADLVVTQRTNRTRSPGLFSLVDSLWCGESTDHCQGDKSSQILSSQNIASQPSRPLTSPPSYCYILTVEEDSHVTPCDGEGQHNYKSPSLTTLRDLSLYHGDAPKRFSVWCRVICSRPSLSIKAHGASCQSWTGQLLVTDASLHHGHSHTPQEPQDSSTFAEGLPQYLKIDVKSSHVMSQAVRMAVLDAGSVLYFQDIACSSTDDHCLYSDSYTTIKKAAIDPCQADLDTGDVKIMSLNIYTDLVALRTREFIPSLSSSSTKESLCKVEGVVQGVDEDSACCWLECTVCSCQDLLERSGLPYYCPVCKDDISDPLTKTNLDVMIQCDSWKDAHVRVKLLQATIEQLLPVSYQDSDQGYDIECVLGKRLGPLYCYIEEFSRITTKLDEIVVSL